MNCPICSSETRVLTKDGEARRRECVGCKYKFTTVEVLQEAKKRQEQAVKAVLEAANRIRDAA